MIQKLVPKPKTTFQTVSLRELFAPCVFLESSSAEKVLWKRNPTHTMQIMIQSEIASSRTHHLLSLWAITLDEILLVYKDQISPARLPDFQVGNFSAIPSTLFALPMRLVISLFPTTTRSITFVLINLHFFATVYILLSCFPVCLLYNLSKIEQLFQPVPLFFRDIWNPSSSLCDLALRLCNLFLTDVDVGFLLLGFVTFTLKFSKILFWLLYTKCFLFFFPTTSRALKSIQVLVLLLCAPFLKDSGKATIQSKWVGVFSMISINVYVPDPTAVNFSFNLSSVCILSIFQATRRFFKGICVS